MARLSRPLRLLLAAVGVLVFLVLCLALARVFTADTGRTVAVEIVRAEVRGDRRDVLRRLDGCDRAACRAEALRSLARLHQAGRFQVLNVDSALHAGLGGAHGPVRVAWRVDTRLPVVQCVGVRRTGSILTGFQLRVERLPAPINRESNCPR